MEASAFVRAVVRQARRYEVGEVGQHRRRISRDRARRGVPRSAPVSFRGLRPVSILGPVPHVPIPAGLAGFALKKAIEAARGDEIDRLFAALADELGTTTGFSAAGLA